MFARSMIFAASMAALGHAAPSLAQDLSSGRWTDLTHPFNAEFGLLADGQDV